MGYFLNLWAITKISCAKNFYNNHTDSRQLFTNGPHFHLKCTVFTVMLISMFSVTIMKFLTNEEHIIKEILVETRVKRATSKKDLGQQSYALFRKQYCFIPCKRKKLYRSRLRCIII